MDRTSQPAEFDGDTWKFKALEDYVSYKSFHDLVSNSSALQAYVDSFGYHANNPEILPHSTEGTLRRQKRKDIESALNHYASQTIVSLCTCYEVAVRDYYRCTFSAHPDKLFEYIGPDSAKGHVHLSEITRHNSREELLIELARRGTAVAAKGDYGKSLARARKISGCDLEIDTSALSALQRTRNSIVHEKARCDISLRVIQDAHSTVDSAIECLCRFGLVTGLPGRYTCIDGSLTMTIHGVGRLESQPAAI